MNIGEHLEVSLCVIHLTPVILFLFLTGIFIFDQLFLKES